MIRKFYLENSNGQRFYFKYSSGVLLSQVEGLGFALDLSYLKYDHVHQFVKRDLPLLEISATLTFLSGYEGYQKLIDYLNHENENLKLFDESFDTKYLYVDVASLSKRDIRDGALTSEIVFNKRSYWIKERLVLMEVGSSITGKIYPYGYAYSYQNTISNQTQLKIGGCMKASTKLEIIGSIDHPEVIVTQHDRITSTLKLNITKNNTKLIISSVPNNQYMHLEENNETIDIYAYQDFTKDNFIYLDTGDLTLEFRPGIVGENLCKVHIYEYHLG